jgi:hypothetical protein
MVDAVTVALTVVGYTVGAVAAFAIGAIASLHSMGFVMRLVTKVGHKK